MAVECYNLAKEQVAIVQHVTRISIAEFSPEATRIMEQVATSGLGVEVVWPDGRVVLVRQERLSRIEEVSALREQHSVVTDTSQIVPPSEALIAQRQAALAQMDRLREEIAREHPGVVFDAVADIHAAREERSAQLEPR